MSLKDKLFDQKNTKNAIFRLNLNYSQEKYVYLQLHTSKK